MLIFTNQKHTQYKKKLAGDNKLKLTNKLVVSRQNIINYNVFLLSTEIQ